MLEWTPWIIGAFLAGSIPFGVLIGRLRGINIREHGSKNIGATNVGRILGKPWGRLCFALDMLKGALPVMLAGLMMNTWGHDLAHLGAVALWGWTLTMVAPVLGHMFPPWLGFRGGKGVATGFGAMLAMFDLITVTAIAALLVWYVVLRATRYVSLSSIAGAASLPVSFVVYALSSDSANVMNDLVTAVTSPPFFVLILLAGLVIFQHRANIGRLRRGEEPKIAGIQRRGAVITDSSEH